MSMIYRLSETGEIPYVLPLGRIVGPRFEVHGVRIFVRAGEAVQRFDFDLEAAHIWAGHQLPAWRGRIETALRHIGAVMPGFAGLAAGRARLMGVVNVTPDSFSDGGAFIDPGRAIAHGRALVAAGAEMIDIGGESTRPGAAPVSRQEECDRVLPVIEGLRDIGVPLSIDTRHGPVMAAAVQAGAKVINDVTALSGDPAALETAARAKVPVILMHMRGDPATMQEEPGYDHVLFDVYDYLATRIQACLAAGIARDAIAIDPGIGFGKTDAHNFELIAGLALFIGLGCPIVLGVSRKSLIGRTAGIENPQDRLAGSLALGLAGCDQGAGILRVHDVAATRQAMTLWTAARRPGIA